MGYSGDPTASELDYVRFIIGDTNDDELLATDTEILMAIASFPILELAGAWVLRGVAAYYSRFVNHSEGSISTSASDLAKQYQKVADRLDPDGLTINRALPTISVGGLSKAEKAQMVEDPDAIQFLFARGQNDIPGGPNG